MAKGKQPAPRNAGEPADRDEDALAQQLSELAIELATRKQSRPMNDALKQKQRDFHKIIRKGLQQKKDDILYEALEHAMHGDIRAYRLLKESIEEASEIVLFKRDDRTMFEVNAFVIPMFVHTTGGLDSRQCFQDQEAFELLVKSFKEAQLESKDATVVLVSHAYHLDEIDRIAYSDLNEMVREAFASMTGKKAAASPAIDRSIIGWPENRFGPQDQAVELRFLLGFALKTTDDPFYHVPKSESAADAYFEQRAERFRRWTERIAPVIKRCLCTSGAIDDVNFLYQDLFHGGKETGIAEYFLLQMMSDLNHALDERSVDAKNTRAVIGTADVDGETVLRVMLHATSDGNLVASSDKPLRDALDLHADIADAADALTTIGVASIAIAESFDAGGKPVNARPYRA